MKKLLHLFLAFIEKGGWCMLGAIIGDIVGSVYEFDSHKMKEFPLFVPECRPTDDSILTIAVGCACVMSELGDEKEFKSNLARLMREIGRQYSDAGFGKGFYCWMMDDNGEAYGSSTNGSAMRVSPVAWAAGTLEEAERLAKWSAEITHNHPDGIKGAQAVAASVFMARSGKTKEEIRNYVEEKYYDLDFTLDEIRPSYKHEMSCNRSVPQAIVCFLEAQDFEDALRNAVSLGGDGDTLAAIAGSIAEAYYGIPDDIQEEALEYLDDGLKDYYYEYSGELYT